MGGLRAVKFTRPRQPCRSRVGGGTLVQCRLALPSGQGDIEMQTNARVIATGASIFLAALGARPEPAFSCDNR